MGCKRSLNVPIFFLIVLHILAYSVELKSREVDIRIGKNLMPCMKLVNILNARTRLHVKLGKLTEWLPLFFKC
jgi:hypothetical protein